jgi:hypothetical protein
MKLEEYAEPAAELLKNLKALNTSTKRHFGRLSIPLRDRLITDPFSTVADAYETDIRARLVGYDWRKVSRLLNRPARGINRFMLLLDDYESVSAVLGDFLVAHLFPKLVAAPYPVLVIIVGRDDLCNADMQFGKDLAPFIKDRIALQPFTREEAVIFLKQAGYDESESEILYAESNGFPFVLSLLADFKANQDERPATFYQQFHDRNTHWMTDQQKEWLLSLCYLDEVNEGTIRKMLPNTSPSYVINWFRNEPSVRDNKAPRFRVDPYIRKMLLQHHANVVGATIQRDFEMRGKAACTNGT